MKTFIFILLFPLLASAGKITVPVINGQCSITQAAPGDSLVIPASADKYINIARLAGTSKKHISIRTAHIFSLSPWTLAKIENCQYVDFFIDAEIINCRYRAIEIKGLFNHNTFQGPKADGVADYFLFANHSLSTINKYNYFSNMSVKHANANVFMVGFAKGNAWRYTSFKNISIDSTFYGSAMVLEWCFDTKIDGCRFTNIGLKETAHTAVIFLRGDGSITNNTMANTWGDAARFFGIGYKKTGLCSFTGNIFMVSRKYGIEANTQPADTNATYRPANYLFQNNVVADIQASGYTAAAFDIYYAFAGPVVIKDNICKGVDGLWHNGTSNATVYATNNLILP